MANSFTKTLQYSAPRLSVAKMINPTEKQPIATLKPLIATKNSGNVAKIAFYCRKIYDYDI